jgi:hypothetical protein
MTLRKLHNLLGKMIANGEGRRPVCISKTTFTHPCEGDGATILNVQDAFLQMVSQADDDGGTKVNKDGSEAMRGCLVLVGDCLMSHPTSKLEEKSSKKNAGT